MKGGNGKPGRELRKGDPSLDLGYKASSYCYWTMRSAKQGGVPKDLNIDTQEIMSFVPWDPTNPETGTGLNT